MAVLGAVALSGCMHRPGPVARGYSDLDRLAYGGTRAAPPPGHAAYAPRANAPGMVDALRNSYASAARPRYAPPSPMPFRQSYGPRLTVPARNADYRLDSGDRLRIVVYGQDGLTNSYAVSAGGTITMPLIGSVQARGLTPAQLASHVSDRLRDGFIREPHVAAEVEAYRPFFILGEVAAPGQYPYVPNMTAESAVAIAGGYSPRARRDSVTIDHSSSAGTVRAVVPPATPINPGDTVVVGERWF
ncbi:MAG: polysaccharide export protein [Xanthobacteraceae bacterium]|nr:polysaccharide export protein [Xanthobacteraceae bacterium]